MSADASELLRDSMARAAPRPKEPMKYVGRGTSFAPVA